MCWRNVTKSKRSSTKPLRRLRSTTPSYLANELDWLCKSDRRRRRRRVKKKRWMRTPSFQVLHERMTGNRSNIFCHEWLVCIWMCVHSPACAAFFFPLLLLVTGLSLISIFSCFLFRPNSGEPLMTVKHEALRLVPLCRTHANIARGSRALSICATVSVFEVTGTHTHTAMARGIDGENWRVLIVPRVSHPSVVDV